MIKLKINKIQNGFTLLEVLVAISIFTVSTLALLSVLSQGITSTNYAKKKIIASYLAEEGVEYVRNMRDTLVTSNIAASAGWTAFKDSVSPACDVDGCYFDDSNVLMACSSGSCPNMTYDVGTGIYSYNPSAADSGYNRVITFEILTVDEIKVNSTVSWSQGSGDYSITFSDNLFNWIE